MHTALSSFALGLRARGLFAAFLGLLSCVLFWCVALARFVFGVAVTLVVVALIVAGLSAIVAGVIPALGGVALLLVAYWLFQYSAPIRPLF